MKIKQKMSGILFGLLLAITFVSIPVTSYAADGCGGVDTAIIKCDADNKTDTNGDGKVDVADNGVWALLLMGINILTAGIGIAAVGGIIYGAILYTTAGDNASQITQAKGVIRNVVIGIIMYVAMYALLQFIIPGGIFS